MVSSTFLIGDDSWAASDSDMKWRRVAKVVILSTLINSIHIQCGEEEALLLDPDVAGRVKRSGGGDGGYDVWYECQTSNTGNNHLPVEDDTPAVGIGKSVICK